MTGAATNVIEQRRELALTLALALELAAGIELTLLAASAAELEATGPSDTSAAISCPKDFHECII